MDAEILYSLIGIFGFIVVIVLTLRSANKKIEIKTKTQKKAEIISEYKLKLTNALQVFEGDKESRVAEKTRLIKEYSDELSRNIFFDEKEVRDIVTELSVS